MAPPPAQDPTIKILLIGPSNSGKTALLLRYVDDIFDTDSATATIGVDFRVKKLAIKGKPHRLLLFDTAGQERFRTLTSSYYRNAQGCILVYDVSNRESFLSMEHWFGECARYAEPGVIKYLVGSKIDKASARAVSTAEGKALADRFNAGFVEVSSKTRENIKTPFVETVDKIVESPELMNTGLARKRNREGAVNLQQDSGEAGGYCAC
ncbi:P-loop containing nucleoside triphosphate hydrolase protein [Pyronema domesticum]|uniref:Similar to Ras-related protein Rab-18-B acc. no. Q6DHC1 n=1 Tax=Pyronema omphalodes (strain CBS 100304) TaxID=1076935 RepID=U4L3M6_PYROM|nr:P-loop containing nucleoside triphosphate hydrolase protein [Pyronema domesticum]CCX11350.1 Similar to Ras-related protein Rab-18-B; acc. no. Q6DHC1 [Pyronema omphalodes CBS 100304]